MNYFKDNSFFKKNCQQAIEKLTEEDFEKFRSAQDAETRIKTIHYCATTIPVTQIFNNSNKDSSVAESEKVRGNAYFLKKDYQHAIRSYNLGIVNCPQDTNESKELLSILIANRSAAFFELDEFKKVFNDIDYITEVGYYPKHLQYKLWLRKGKCYENLQNERSANEAYDQTIEYLRFSNLDEVSISQKIEELSKIRGKTIKSNKIHELVPFSNTDLFLGSKEYVSALNKLSFDQDMVQGRYARASEDLETGVVIVEENSHCSVLSAENALSNCQYCLISTIQVFACPNCSNVIFCSINCRNLAIKSYHKFECGFLETLLQSGASINCYMALRIITQRNLKYFSDKKKRLRDYLKDNCKKPIIKKIPYRPDDYETVFFLCRNEFSRKKEELVHYSCMAVYLLNLLKTSSYFDDTEIIGEPLTEDQLFLAALILRHLEILQFNSHEISELRNMKGNLDDNESLYTSEYIGAGLYPTVALFNHSCDPSIVRYHIGSKMIVRTIKPIEAGEIIYENYGPLYTTMKKEYRQKFLMERYWFECLCPACAELWPLLGKMNKDELRLPCTQERCPYVFVIHREECCPFLTCEYCNTSTSLIPFLKGLMMLETIIPEAENFYGMGQFDHAMKKYIEALNILFKYSRPPCPDMVNIQQRLRTCMLHYGNKSVDYVAPFSL